MFNETMMMEKKDACYYKVKASAKVWPSAYASGRLVQCRKKGADNYGNKSKNEGANDAAPKMGAKEKKLAQGALKGAKDMSAALGLVRGKDGVARLPKEKKDVVEGDMYGDQEVSWEKGGRRAPTGAFRNPAAKKPQTYNDPDWTKNLPKEKLDALAGPRYKKDKGVAEEYNAEYDDEAGMAQGSLHTLQNAVEGLQQVIDSGDNLPEWCQEKISLAEDYLVTVWDYIQSEKAQGVDPEITEMYEALEDLVLEMAEKNQVDEDLVWESFEAMPDSMLYETAAWRRKEGKSKKGGLNAKGVASYRRENPGSKLQMAVTTKPSKLKKGSKAAKRRKSFCARMSGVKGPMKKPNGKPTRKALALRKWNC
jgi:hypothetical protein